jgi:hypothetical protein
MSRFYFHTDDHRDNEGTELSSLSVAKCHAVQMTGTIICDESESFWDKAECNMTVTDENNLTLFQIQVVGTEAPSIRGASPRHDIPTSDNGGRSRRL